MGLLAPKIESAEALKTIAKESIKPWYQKVESWLILVNIIALIANMVIMIMTI
jgi:hypothetical protein